MRDLKAHQERCASKYHALDELVKRADRVSQSRQRASKSEALLSDNCNEINTGSTGAARRAQVHGGGPRGVPRGARRAQVHKGGPQGLPMMADMSVLRVTFVTTLRELTIKDSNVICETTLQVLRVALAIYAFIP